MRTVLFLITVSISHALAFDGFSQEIRLNLNVQNETIVKVLERIEDQSDFYFMFDATVVDLNRRTSINCKDLSIVEILDQIFSGKGISYTILDRQIALTKTNDKVTSQQSGKVSGVVTDAAGQPLPGVSVVINKTTAGTITDTDGRYFMSNIPPDATLIFSFVGMRSQEVSASGKSVINVSMEEETIGLEEVVAVGYGIQKKVNLTGAVSSVDMTKLENRPITNASQTLQGVSGLYVNQAGGQPGKDGATIRVRGQGTLNDNDPLVLVDGIEFSLDDVNPADIESISVLKDAASASIYGNRAANGVILITTKKGSQGKTRIEYSNYFGIQSTTYLPDFVIDPIQFMELRNQAQRNAGRLIVDYSDEMIEEYKAGMLTDPYTYPSNNWLDIMFDNAVVQEHNLQVSGGKENINYNLSLGYLDQDGVLMGTDGNKFSMRSNVNFQVNDYIRVGSDFSVTSRYIHEPATTAGSMMEMIFKAQGFHPTYLEDGRYADTWVRTPGHNVYRHPLVWAKEGYLKNKNLRGLASLYAEIKLPLGLKYFAKAAANKYEGFQNQFVPDIYEYNNKTFEAKRVDYYTSNKNRHVSNRYDDNLNITLYHTLSWDKSFHNIHNISVMAGSSYERFSSRYLGATIEGFLGNDLHEIDAGSTNKENSGSSAANYLVGAFGRLNYNYMQKYLLEANFRYDGSSKFAKGNRWGFFPSFSAGWRLDQEEFLKHESWLSGLKLRASYGSLGNEKIGNFKYVNMLDIGTEYSFGGAVNPGVAVTTYNDPDITWETTTIANVGIDLSVLENKLNLSFEVYDKRTKDILRQVNIPAQVGDLGGPVMNIGEVSNKGFEINLDYRNSVRDFKYRVDAGVNYNVNQVENLNGQVIYDGKYITKEGHPIDSYYLLEADGIFQSQEEITGSPFQNITTKPGYLKYKNQNTDNVINQDDRVIFGGVIPKYTYDFTIDLSWKDWSLLGFFQGVQGVYTYPEQIGGVPFWFGTSVTNEWVTDSWTTDRRDARLPIMTTFEDSQNDNFLQSNFWLQNASYLRLKNLQLTYSFPQVLVKRIGLQNLRLFVNGQNLLTFSKMKNFDPERHIKQGNYYEYPSIKTYSAGLNVTF